MKPIDGVVLNSGQIQLRGGTILSVNHTFLLGQRVQVRWDFTQNCPRHICLDSDAHPIHEVDTSHCRDEEDEHIEYDDLIDEYLGLP